MEKQFELLFGLSFETKLIFDRIHNCDAIQIKNAENKIIFSVKDLEYLYVNNIQKYCDKNQVQVGGKEIMNRIIQLGGILNVKYIELNDCAMINLGDYKEFSIALAPIEIITTGISWYNKLGFISKNSDEEIIENEKINNTLFDELICTEFGYKKLDRFKENFKEIDYDGKTLKQIFGYLKETYINRDHKMRKKMTLRQSDIIEELTIDFCDILCYETTLRHYL